MYEVLGGRHTSTAWAQLHEEQPDNPLFSRVLCEVYVGLTDDEALTQQEWALHPCHDTL